MKEYLLFKRQVGRGCMPVFILEKKSIVWPGRILNQGVKMPDVRKQASFLLCIYVSISVCYYFLNTFLSWLY